jgi:L-asparagine transporter-like permease
VIESSEQNKYFKHSLIVCSCLSSLCFIICAILIFCKVGNNYKNIGYACLLGIPFNFLVILLAHLVNNFIFALIKNQVGKKSVVTLAIILHTLVCVVVVVPLIIGGCLQKHFNIYVLIAIVMLYPLTIIICHFLMLPKKKKKDEIIISNLS